LRAVSARQQELGRVERVRARLHRAPSPEAVADAFELRGRTARCATLADLVGHDVLNIGCSFGWFEEFALREGARRVVGLDASEESLASAKGRVPDAEFVLGSATQLPFPDGIFDVVNAFDVLEHLPKGTELAMLGEMRRVVRTNGRVAVSTPHRDWRATYSDPAFYFGHRHYAVDDVRRLVIEAGFAIESVALAGGSFDVLDVGLYYLWRHGFGRERHPFTFVRRRADREWLRSDGRNEVLLVAVPNQESQ
jgi:SAM-dependent methyltransferase